MAAFEVLPLEIAGFPAIEIPFEEADVRVALWAVDRLDERVDRERLLRDDDIPEPPYWAHVWVGARALARALARGPSLAGRRILDLGCGLGLPGLVAAARGAEVWFADKEKAALEFVAASCERNGERRVRLLPLDFTRDTLDERFDEILAAEIVYEPAAYEPLAVFLDRHLAAGGTIHATDAFRSDAARFFDALRARGFAGERRAAREREDGRWQGLFLWSFRR